MKFTNRVKSFILKTEESWYNRSMKLKKKSKQPIVGIVKPFVTLIGVIAFISALAKEVEKNQKHD